MTRYTSALLPCSVLLAAAVVSSAAPPIAELAPANAFFALEVSDMNAAREALMKTPLGALWETDEIQALMEEALEEPEEAFDEMLDRVSFEIDDPQTLMPTGMIGIAVTMSAKEPEAPGEEEQDWWYYGLEDLAEFDVLVAAEYTENADVVQELANAIIDEWLEEEQGELKEIEHGDTVIKALISANESAGGFDVTDVPMDAGAVAEGVDDMLNVDEPLFDSTYVARVGDVMLIASDEQIIKHAVDRLEDQDAESLSEIEIYQRATARLDKSAQLRCVMLFEPLLRTIRQMDELNKEDFGTHVLMEEIGVANLESLSMEILIDREDAMVVGNYHALFDGEKGGLVGLIKEGQGSFRSPAFADAGISDLSTFHFDFAAVPDLIDDFIGAMPDDDAQYASQGWEQVRAMVTNTLTNLGPSMSLLQWYDRPFALDSEVVLFAVETRDAEAVTQALPMMGMMLGIQEREFLGHRIFDGPETPFAIGLGLGHVFLGPKAAVEQVFRVAEREGETLADVDGFRHAAAMVESSAVGYAFSDPVQGWEYMRWALMNQNELAVEQMRLMREQYRDQFDEEQLDEYLPIPEPEDLPDWLDLLPDGDLLRKFVGPTVGAMKVTDDGFSATAYWLRPVDD